MASKRDVASRFASTSLAWFAIAAWFLLLLAFDVPIAEGLLKPVSIVLTLVSVTLFVFEHWAWRWRWVNWAVFRPNMVGTWKGTLKSSYVDPDTGKAADVQQVFLVVEQNYTELHLRLLTQKSTSVSLSATVAHEADGRLTVSAVYRNEPKIELRERSPIHRGGLQLQLGSGERQRLQGEYWTDRSTVGSLDLELVSRKKASDYEMASQLVD